MHLKLLSLFFLLTSVTINSANVSDDDLYHMIRRGKKNNILKYLNDGGDVNRTTHGSSLLHHAVFYEKYDIAELLIMRGADVDLASVSTQLTPLYYAACYGQFEIFKLLLQHKASPNVKDNYDRTPLHIAAWRNHIEIVKLLLEHNIRLSQNKLIEVLSDPETSTKIKKLLRRVHSQKSPHKSCVIQ